MSHYSRIIAKEKLLNLTDLTQGTIELLGNRKRKTRIPQERLDNLSKLIDNWEDERAVLHVEFYFFYNSNNLISELRNITKSLIQGEETSKDKSEYLSKEYEKLQDILTRTVSDPEIRRKIHELRYT
jgi:hypothetical protein